MTTSSPSLTPPSALRRSLPLALLLGALVVLGLGLTLSSGPARVWWQVVALGVVEGLTEFLPISSTAHLLISSKLLGFENSIGGTFEIFIQFGAVLAVLGYYARDLAAQARAIPTSAEARRFWMHVVVAFVPAAIVGLLARDWIKAVLFESPQLIATSLILGGIVLIVIELIPRRPPSTTDAQRVTFWQALSVGLVQILALVPGMSRSGSAIVGGMLSGMDRSSATAFSFYLAIPTLGLATLVDLLGSLDQLQGGDIGRLLVGALVSFVVAWLSIGWLLRYVATNRFVGFGIYRIAAGLLILALVGAGIL
ncbi:MAG: undecaprenyl-diphosphate phosphatase [Roseiflexaceae bacterium]